VRLATGRVTRWCQSRFERPRERAEGWSSTLGLLSETTVGRFLVNANLLVERNWDVDAEDEGDEGDEAEDGEDGEEEDDEEEARTSLGYQWQVLYRHSHRMYYGVQGMGELGQWDDWAKLLRGSGGAKKSPP